MVTAQRLHVRWNPSAGASIAFGVQCAIGDGRQLWESYTPSIGLNRLMKLLVYVGRTNQTKNVEMRDGDRVRSKLCTLDHDWLRDS